jgi:signal transduction histidine kinase
MVNRARQADLQRAAAYHKMEYSNKMAALGRLSAGVAHEINNPVSIINEKAGLLKDLLLMSQEMPPKERMLELVDSVLRSADRCGGITHRLLGFAKHMEVRTETIELDELLKEVLGFLEKEAAYRNLTVDLDFPEEAPTIVSDRGQLQQVFLNIINNAFAAVDDGGRIEIGIRAMERERVAVWVQDTGVGIPEEHLNRIFDPFFTTKKGGGTGLGLSITYGIVQKLGGDITVKSRPGEGARFTIILPKGKAEL